jgi:uncharacterized membrane protein YphA (DoxX/SURF4 family)
MFEAYCREKLGPLVLRLALGLVSVLGGYLRIKHDGGTAWTADLPPTWQLAIAWGEFTAGVAILAGFRCRWAAAVVLALQVGQQIWWHGWNVFDQSLPRLEWLGIVLLMGLALLFLGGGGLSVDARGGGGGRGAPARAGKKR